MVKNSYRVNEEIKAAEVRIIDDKGKQVGVMPRQKALELAKEKELDLVEVAPSAKPPVVKIINVKHFLFQREKQEKAAKKGGKSELKEFRIRPNIGENDLGIRVRRAEEFLKEGNQVKLTVVFRGRENAHPEIGLAKIKIMLEQLKEVGIPEKEPERLGKIIEVVINPRR